MVLLCILHLLFSSLSDEILLCNGLLIHRHNNFFLYVEHIIVCLNNSTKSILFICCSFRRQDRILFRKINSSSSFTNKLVIYLNSSPPTAQLSSSSPKLVVTSLITRLWPEIMVIFDSSISILKRSSFSMSPCKYNQLADLLRCVNSAIPWVLVLFCCYIAWVWDSLGVKDQYYESWRRM